LRSLAESAGTATEAVRRAISVYKFLQDEVMRGRKIHIIDSNGSHVRELVFEDDH
jgi:hypothetical protein